MKKIFPGCIIYLFKGNITFVFFIENKLVFLHIFFFGNEKKSADHLSEPT